MGIFGISKREVWQQLCQETTANYMERGFWKGDRVEMPFQNWNIVLDNYAVSTGKTTVVYTRIRMLFVRKNDFTFRVYKKGIFSSIAKAFGANQIETGNPSIDETFVVKGNNEEKIRSLFANKRLTDLLLSQPQMDFQAKRHGNKSGDTAILIYQVAGVVKDVERLKNLFELFGETIITLDEMGVVSTNIPQAVL